MEKKPSNIQGRTSSSSRSSSRERQQQPHYQTAPSSSSFLAGGISQNPGLHGHIPQTNTTPVVPAGLSHLNFFTELLHPLWQKPEENSIEFWSKYVDKFYDSDFVASTCLSISMNYESPITDWKCRICTSAPSKGYRLTFKGLPRNIKHKFDKVMTGERYNVMWSSEYNCLGITTLVCEKATHDITLTEGNHVVCEGVLRVTITHQKKLLSWDFCVRHHEEYVSLSSLSNMVQNHYRMANEAGQPQQEEEES